MVSHVSRAITKRQRRLEQKAEQKVFSMIRPQNFELQEIQPLTKNQTQTFKAYEQGLNLVLHGCAGTGKTFITLYLALSEIFSGSPLRRRIIIVRSAQSSKDIGHLPGNEKQKIEVYESVYRAICSELFNRADAYEVLKQKGVIEFHSTSFLRGSTIDDAIILYDEIQNSRYHELRTVLTRIGENTRIILCGDTKQDDLTSERYKEQSGLQDMMKVFKLMDTIKTIEFTTDDIVRSGFVKSFIIAENKLGLY